MNDTRIRGYAVMVAAAGAAAALGPVYAQENGKVMIDVADCIKLAAPEARLACYESRVAAVFGERAAQAAAARPAATPAPAAPTVAPATPTAEPAPARAAAGPVLSASPAAPPAPPAPQRAVAVTSAAEPAASAPAPSRSDRQSRRQESDRAEADAAANDIVSRVKDLREVFPNAWQITLENGQVWRQTVSKHYELRSGAQVKIYTSHWGSAMRLSAEDLNGYIQVERVH